MKFRIFILQIKLWPVFVNQNIHLQYVIRSYVYVLVVTVLLIRVKYTVACTHQRGCLKLKKRRRIGINIFPPKPSIVCVLSETVWLILQETGLPVQKEAHSSVAFKRRLCPYKPFVLHENNAITTDRSNSLINVGRSWREEQDTFNVVWSLHEYWLMQCYLEQFYLGIKLNASMNEA
jgi:hypothetical protein